LQPFGAGNAQPMFVANGVHVANVRQFAEDCHELRLEDASGRMKAVLWPSASSLLPLLRESRADVLFQVEPDRFDGARVVIADARIAS
jgi:hypothetical protein